jgi:2-oxoglutarate ferredoxin oxidoreductase subunit beta
MPFGTFPMALGVLFDDPRPTFEAAVREQNEKAAAGKPADLQALVSEGQSWMVTKEPHAI